ncbi:hypothetical protein TcG_12023 [Trypanosoma cruzi]|nr:hypothetical protein TcG_12023 [Trypanosoma cruzi]
MCPHIVDKRTLPQVGQEDVNPPLAGRQGVAVLTSGGGSGGGSGGPATAVREGRHHRHRGFLVIRRARAGLSKSGQESRRAFAQCRHSGTMSGSTPGTESCHTDRRLSRGVRAFLFLLGILPL